MSRLPARQPHTSLLDITLPSLLLCVVGAVGEDNIVRVEFVYEPPQQGSQDELLFERGTPQEAQVGLLGSCSCSGPWTCQMPVLLWPH
jgi:hypothetical protein